MNHSHKKNFYSHLDVGGIDVIRTILIRLLEDHSGVINCMNNYDNVTLDNYIIYIVHAPVEK